jgi:hypothetical protein
MIGFIDTFCSLSYSQSITALPPIYPLHKLLGHAIGFLVTDLSQELSLQIIMKSSCHFLFNHLGMSTLQNSTQFSDANSLIPSGKLKVGVILGLTVSRPVCLGVKHPSGAYDQIFITVRRFGFVDVLRSLWRETGSAVYSCSCQHSHSRVRNPRDSWPYFTVSGSRLH